MTYYSAATLSAFSVLNELCRMKYVSVASFVLFIFLNFNYLFCRLCVIAGNISPIDVITHVPILCEESEIPYIYVPSKEVRDMGDY